MKRYESASKHPPSSPPPGGSEYWMVPCVAMGLWCNQGRREASRKCFDASAPPVATMIDPPRTERPKAARSPARAQPRT